MAKKLSTDEFVEKARKVHGKKYDYSKVKYTGYYNKICIICPKHGEFWQTPNSHLEGRGCPICSGNKQMTTEEFMRSLAGIPTTLGVGWKRDNFSRKGLTLSNFFLYFKLVKQNKKNDDNLQVQTVP